MVDMVQRMIISIASRKRRHARLVEKGLTTQLSIIQEEETNDVDPFEINADDMEDASQPSHIIDEDDFIDVILC